jgi:hypothetical protein
VWFFFSHVLDPGLPLYNAHLGSQLHRNTHQWLKTGHTNLEANVFLSLLLLPKPAMSHISPVPHCLPFWPLRAKSTTRGHCTHSSSCQSRRPVTELLSVVMDPMLLTGNL